jgi:hypothetical protein
MERPEYVQMKLSNLPQEFVDLYNLTKIAEDNGNMYIKVQKRKCTACLKQASWHIDYWNNG